MGKYGRQENYQKVAEESEVKKILELLQSLLGSELQQASQDARIAASSFVDKRKGQLLGPEQSLFSLYIYNVTPVNQ